MNVMEVSRDNVQTQRPQERPQEVTKKLTGAINGLQGSRYTGTGLREWKQGPWQFLFRGYEWKRPCIALWSGAGDKHEVTATKV